MHTTLAHVGHLDRPDFLVFDLDPGEGVGMPACAEVALEIRKYLQRDGLAAYPKASGGKGIHLYVPLHTETTYERTKSYARRLAIALELKHPSLVTSKMAKKLRAGRVFIDWSQNSKFKTTVTVYSLRANPSPTVSVPLQWKEVQALAKRKGNILFSPADALKRVDRFGDLFAPVLKQRQTLPRT